MSKKIIGTDGDDAIVVSGPSEVFTFGGDDKVTLDFAGGSPFAGIGLSFVDTGAGDDRVVSEVQNGSEIHLGAGNDRFVADLKAFSSLGDVVLGENGNDRFGVAGLDTHFLGGAGKDLFEFEVAGRLNQVIGGAGKDTVSFKAVDPAAVGDISINLRLGIATFSDQGKDVLGQVENIIGTHGNDEITGDDRANVLNGAGGLDEIEGGDGRDRLVGGALGDTLTGDEGADTFVFLDVLDSTGGFASTDRILDFTRDDGDRIDLSAIDANLGKGGDQAFRFIGTGAFSGKAGELRFDGDVIQADGTNTVFADVDGDGVADMVFDVNLTDFVSGDFIL
jgi:serralysin